MYHKYYKNNEKSIEIYQNTKISLKRNPVIVTSGICSCHQIFTKIIQMQKSLMDIHIVGQQIMICDEKKGYVRELSRISPIVRHMVDAPRMKRLYVEK